jgi:hypothetical protein
MLLRVYLHTYPGVQRFSGVRDLGGDEAEKTSGRDQWTQSIYLEW